MSTTMPVTDTLQRPGALDWVPTTGNPLWDENACRTNATATSRSLRFVPSMLLDGTRVALLLCKDARSWHQVGRELGLPHSVLADIGRERWQHISYRRLIEVRRALGLPELPAVCPCCGRPL